MCAQTCVVVFNMSKFIPNKEHSRTALIFFSFEKNYWWIIPITSRSSWWITSIARYVWSMVSMFQKCWLWHKTRRKTRNLEKRQKILQCRIASIVGRKWFSNIKTTRRAIGGWSTSCFQSVTRDGKQLVDQPPIARRVVFM